MLSVSEPRRKPRRSSTEKDAEVAALREGKDFAGDQDPYKKDEDAEEA